MADIVRLMKMEVPTEGTDYDWQPVQIDPTEDMADAYAYIFKSNANLKIYMTSTDEMTFSDAVNSGLSLSDLYTISVKVNNISFGDFRFFNFINFDIADAGNGQIDITYARNIDGGGWSTVYLNNQLVNGGGW